MDEQRRARTVAPWHLPIAASVAVVVLGRLLLIGVPLGRDEGGYLIVGSGWHGPGDMAYGEYWVDRPPLLIWIMQLAGDLTTLRLLGCLATVLTVLGVAWAAHLARGPQAACWAAGTAALLGVAHWLGVARVNGEMLAGAFVAWSLALTLHALLRASPGRAVAVSAAGAGALAAGAVLIKQTIIDGFVFAVVLAVVIAWTRRPGGARVAARLLLWGVSGAAAAVGIALAAAAVRGTTPGELFEVLVSFRVEAGEVIRVSASAATGERLVRMLATWALSGLGLLTVLTVWHGARHRDPIVLAVLATLAYVSAAALLGGSYWGHYLQQLVPAAALAAGLLASATRPQVRRGLAALTVALTLGNLVWAATRSSEEGREAEVVGTWLRDSGKSSDTAVVAYGQPNVLGNAGMTSPYPYLWSLPVRTLDPDLHELSSVLAGPERPTWFVDWSGLDSWGVAPTRLEPVLHEHYRQVVELCGRTVWLAVGVERTLAAPGGCS